MNYVYDKSLPLIEALESSSPFLCRDEETEAQRGKLNAFLNRVAKPGLKSKSDPNSVFNILHLKHISVLLGRFCSLKWKCTDY